MRTILLHCAAVAALTLWTPPAVACPICESDTGRKVRAEIFGTDFGTNAVLTLLPFPVLLGLVALIHYGFPSPKRQSRPQEERNA